MQEAAAVVYRATAGLYEGLENWLLVARMATVPLAGAVKEYQTSEVVAPKVPHPGAGAPEELQPCTLNWVLLVHDCPEAGTVTGMAVQGVLLEGVGALPPGFRASTLKVWKRGGRV